MNVEKEDRFEIDVNLKKWSEYLKKSEVRCTDLELRVSRKVLNGGMSNKSMLPWKIILTLCDLNYCSARYHDQVTKE